MPQMSPMTSLQIFETFGASLMSRTAVLAPATFLEAMALNLADNADAKMETMIEVLRAAGNNQGWLGYNRLLETNIRKTTEI